MAQAAEAERRKKMAEQQAKIELQAKIDRRIKHIRLGFDVDADVQRSPAELQAKL